MSIVRAIRDRRNRRPMALLLGLPGLVMAILAMTGSTALAAGTATAASKPSPARATVSAVSGHTARHAPATVSPAPVSPAPRKPARHVTPDSTCPFLYVSSLATSATTVSTGSDVTVTATTPCDVGPTPYYIQIFDSVAGTVIATCGSGTSCSATVSQSFATTEGYVAYLTQYSTTYPPTNAYGLPTHIIYVTWEAPPAPFTVSLSGPTLVGTGVSGTYTATASENVGPTPYFIEIFDETTGKLLGSCGSGTVCSISFLPSYGGDTLVAFVAGYSTSAPPEEAQASSSLLTTEQEIPLN